MPTRRENWGGVRQRRVTLGVIYSLLLASVALLPAQTTTGSSTLVLTTQEKEWLRQHPRIRVGLDPAWPPFSYISRDNELVGMDLDMLQVLHERLGITFVTVSGKNWSEVYAKAQNHEVDMLAGLAQTPERTALFNFTESYVEFPVGIITRVDAPFMIGFSQLEGQPVAAARDYAPTLFLQREYPKVQLVMTENVGEALRRVSRGEAFATIDNLVSANYLIKDQGLGNLKVAGITNFQFELRYGVRKDWPELADILHHALTSLSDRDRESIKEKWIDLKVDQMLDSRFHEKVLLIGFAILGGAALVVCVWNWTLAYEIKRRKKAEEELKEARNKAVDANRMKSAFLANFSHEIRNPLNALLGFTELLKQETAEQRLKKYVEAIDAGGRTLLGIINDVLDLSKVEAGRLEIHVAPVDLRVILSETHALFAHRAAQKNLEFIEEVDASVPPLLLLDELRLRQVLYNAVTNAIKFTSKGSIRITARCAPSETAPDKKVLTLAVIDTGIGIPAEDHQRIFEPFAQRVGQNPLLGGTGLGLAISKRLTELMGGHLEMESALWKGSTFRFIFPEVEEAPREIHKPAARIGDLAEFKPLKVLVIDDLESNRELLKEYFQRAGHLVWDAADAEQGIVSAQTHPPDIILLDYRLPGMDGREAARHLKIDSRTKDIPVVFLSGSLGIAMEAATDPQFVVLAKPLVYADLVATLRRLLPHAIKEPTG